MKITPAGFKKLVEGLALAEGRTVSFDEHKRVVERANCTVSLKLIYVILYKSNDAVVRVEYEDGEVGVNLLEKSSRYYNIDWSPADLRNLAKALEFAAEVSEKWYTHKYSVEHPEFLPHAA